MSFKASQPAARKVRNGMLAQSLDMLSKIKSGGMESKYNLFTLSLIASREKNTEVEIGTEYFFATDQLENPVLEINLMIFKYIKGVKMFVYNSNGRIALSLF